MNFPRESLAFELDQLSKEGIYLGTSSWKYEGWLGLLYSPERYETRGKFSLAKFEKTCLKEYGKVFKSVCFDGGFYQFPNSALLTNIFSQVPDDFRLSIKVTEEITTLRFPNFPRYGKRAGQQNPHFLDAPHFISQFLGPLEPYREKMGTLIFEFGHFQQKDWERGRDFVEVLGLFLSQLPKGWNYSVEIRNENFLRQEYFEVLRRNGVSHAFNSWSRMPSVAKQISMEQSFTADFASARFLLKPGRLYEEAVSAFSPYREIKDPYPEARTALVDLLKPKPGRPNRKFIYVNNRLEGSSLWTIVRAIKEFKPEIVADGEPG